MEARILSKYGLFFPSLDALVVSDLHLGYEDVLQSRGVTVPFPQFQLIKKWLGEMLEETGARRVIVNGDLKHEFSKATRQEWREVLSLLDFFQEKKVTVDFVKGNHDNFVFKILAEKGFSARDWLFEGGEKILFAHGHKGISELNLGNVESEFETLVLGHEHPAISLRDELGIKHKFKCVLEGELQWKNKTRKIIVLPSISPYAPGTEINGDSRGWDKNYLSPILAECDSSNFLPTVVDDEGGVKKFPRIGLLP
jgi:putative SbcD/Mre11-related phosphoesterase